MLILICISKLNEELNIISLKLQTLGLGYTSQLDTYNQRNFIRYSGQKNVFR